MANDELESVEFAHVVFDSGQEFRTLVGGMGREAQELTDLLDEAIDTKYYGLYLLPLRGVCAGDQGSLVGDLN